jgi:uncharacterized protein (TIGR01777 family)
MNISLTGASGFIGATVVRRLQGMGHNLTVLGRRDPGGGLRFAKWDSVDGNFPENAIAGADAIIHLAGEPVAQRWSKEVKQRIRDSRVYGTNCLVQALARTKNKPKVLISASAIGYYGDRADEALNEHSKAGGGFLPEICQDWELAARSAESLGIRVVLLRIGIVLHHSGGALRTMLTPFKLGVGGPIGSGNQWMSWIHRDDLVAMILWALENPNVSGPINGVGPSPCRNAEFVKALGHAISRPALLPVPGFALRVLYGEMADVILSSQRVLPDVPASLGFQFQYPELPEALRAAVE